MHKIQMIVFRNPFSETYGVPHFDKNAADYGRPPPGSKTEARGIKVRIILGAASMENYAPQSGNLKLSSFS